MGRATGSGKKFTVSRGRSVEFQKIVGYGPGGVGKTELFSLVKEVGIRPLFIDPEDGSKFLDVPRVKDINSWEDLQAVLQDQDVLNDGDMVILDSGTKAEHLIEQWVIANVKHTKTPDKPITCIADYGFGEGEGFVHGQFRKLLALLDGVYRMGKHVAVIAHECTANVPNPGGEDFIRYEPRLQSPKGGKASNRHLLKEWGDHLFFIGYDIAVNKDGKAKGSGSRAIYTTETATHWAKSRDVSETIVYPKGSAELWQKLFQKG